MPRHIILTGLPSVSAGGIDLSLAVRVDLIGIVRRDLVSVEKAPTPGASGPGRPRPEQVEATVIFLTAGGQLFVRESVAEVHALLKKNSGGFFK